MHFDNPQNRYTELSCDGSAYGFAPGATVALTLTDQFQPRAVVINPDALTQAEAARAAVTRRVPATDVRVTDHGSVVLFHPLTDAARDWLSDNVGDDAMYLGDALACEHRFAGDLADGMVCDGLGIDVDGI